MGLSSLPSPSEGMLTLILVNTALTVSILKQIVRSVVSFFVQTRFNEPDELAVSDLTLTERFRARFKPIRFGSAACRRRTERNGNADCRVCLNRFEPESVVNRLPCGHVFHKACLETWLDYQRATCPLCRSHLLNGIEEQQHASVSSF
ncbi:hypothetical protein LUZ60_003270 [Juncus effusus]|nr:hypothetical protein LUZ60_003270 [Juncus effusus]